MTHRIILVDIGAGLTLTGVLPSVALNADYNARLQARGGQAPYAYTIVAGALPVGLQLDLTTGTISGTATVAGHASFTVRATDITGAHVQRVYSIRVVSEPLSISGAAPAWTVGTAYSYTYGVMHGSPPYTWSIEAGALPAGITLNASTGTISGTPTAPNAPAWTVRVTDSDGAHADLRDNASMQLLGTFSNATVGTAYTSDLSITGGDMPYGNARVTVGVLPTWASLSIVGAKLRLSGTPTGDATTVTITAAVDSSNGQTATSAQSITIAAAAAGYAASVLADSPTGYWPCDELSGTVITDHSGNGLHGTYNTASYVQLGAAPLRTGATASVRVASAGYAGVLPSMDVNGHDWAMECVADVEAKTGNWSTIFGANGMSGGPGTPSICANAAQFRAVANSSFSCSVTTSTRHAHLVLERRSGVPYFYVNGVLANFSTGSVVNKTFVAYLLGSHSYPTSYGIIGSASDFAFYDHPLGPDRVLAHAQAAGLA